MAMTDTERKHFVALLRMCGDLLGDQGCNDFPIPNTDENWAMAERMGAENLGVTVEEWRKHRDYEPRPKGDTLYLMDWAVLGYLAKRVAE